MLRERTKFGLNRQPTLPFKPDGDECPGTSTLFRQIGVIKDKNFPQTTEEIQDEPDTFKRNLARMIHQKQVISLVNRNGYYTCSADIRGNEFIQIQKDDSIIENV